MTSLLLTPCCPLIRPPIPFCNLISIYHYLPVFISHHPHIKLPFLSCTPCFPPVFSPLIIFPSISSLVPTSPSLSPLTSCLPYLSPSLRPPPPIHPVVVFQTVVTAGDRQGQDTWTHHHTPQPIIVWPAVCVYVCDCRYSCKRAGHEGLSVRGWCEVRTHTHLKKKKHTQSSPEQMTCYQQLAVSISCMPVTIAAFFDGCSSFANKLWRKMMPYLNTSTKLWLVNCFSNRWAQYQNYRKLDSYQDRQASVAVILTILF